MTLKGSSVPDKTGSPMAISAVMNYQVEDAIAYAYSVDDPYEYIQNQGAEVLRRVCSKFPYLSNHEPSISKNSSFLGVCLRELTQQRVSICGVTITSMEIMEANYSPEVAQALLQVQQAQAKIDARQLIVEGSVGLVDSALKEMAKKGIDL
jgi:regulator of protease activity HflC (stomatin/prohibitin superfamily)